MKFKKIVWIINFVLFVTCVYFGIEQAGKGSVVLKQEKEIEKLIERKQKLSDLVFVMGRDESLYGKADSLGFSKPANLVYFNQVDESLTFNSNGF